MTDENSKLHLINQENQQAVQEVFNLNSQVAQLQSENETLQKLSDYLQEDVVPTIQKDLEKLKVTMKKQTNEKESLLKEVQILKKKQTDSDKVQGLQSQLDEQKKKAAQQNDLMRTLKLKFDA